MADFTGAQYAADEVLAGIKKNQIAGLPPTNMASFSIKSDNQSAKIRFRAPDNTVVDGQLLCTVKGVMIRRKQGEVPAGITDGDLVLDATGEHIHDYEKEAYIDTGLVNGETYFYKAFAYSDHGIYNLNEKNVASVVPSENAPVWGFHQDFTNTSPANDGTGTITYPEDVENSDFTPAMTNSGTGTVTTGSWDDFMDNVMKNFPHIVDVTTQQSVGELDPDDYTKMKDGTAAAITSCKYAGAWVNKLFMKEVYAADGSSRDVYFAADNEHSNTEDFVPVGFYDQDGAELDGIWIPMFYMDASGNTRSGTTPIASKTCDQEKAIINAVSSRAIFLGGPILNVLRDLEYMIFRSTDIQTYAGHGNCKSYSSDSSTGVKANAVIGGGRFYGTSDKKSLNKLFHSIVLGSYQQLTRDPYMITIGGRLYLSGRYKYSLSGADYENTGVTVTTNSAWTYAKKTRATLQNGSIPDPASKDATSSTGLCDGQYYNTSGTRVARRLGATNSGLNAGPAYVDLRYEASDAAWNCGVGCALLPSAGYAPA